MIIIDYGLGNLASIHNMLKQLGFKPLISDDPKLISKSKDIILPGVGNFGVGMQNLKNKNLDETIKNAAAKGSTILGICLGMHLLLEKSEEGNCKGLGLIDGDVKKFKFKNDNFKGPHMGWNYVKFLKDDRLSFNFRKDIKFYFAHSYYVNCNKDYASSLTNYGFDFVSTINKKNIYGVQFHPEKSHNFGKEFLRNFYS